MKIVPTKSPANQQQDGGWAPTRKTWKPTNEALILRFQLWDFLIFMGVMVIENPSSIHLHLPGWPPRTRTNDNKRSTIRRCTSYWKLGFSNVMLVFRGLFIVLGDQSNFIPAASQKANTEYMIHSSVQKEPFKRSSTPSLNKMGPHQL